MFQRITGDEKTQRKPATWEVKAHVVYREARKRPFVPPKAPSKGLCVTAAPPSLLSVVPCPGAGVFVPPQGPSHWPLQAPSTFSQTASRLQPCCRGPIPVTGPSLWLDDRIQLPRPESILEIRATGCRADNTKGPTKSAQETRCCTENTAEHVPDASICVMRGSPSRIRAGTRAPVAADPRQKRELGSKPRMSA